MGLPPSQPGARVPQMQGPLQEGQWGCDRGPLRRGLGVAGARVRAGSPTRPPWCPGKAPVSDTHLAGQGWPCGQLGHFQALPRTSPPAEGEDGVLPAEGRAPIAASAPAHPVCPVASQHHAHTAEGWVTHPSDPFHSPLGHRPPASWPQRWGKVRSHSAVLAPPAPGSSDPPTAARPSSARLPASRRPRAEARPPLA